jgi:mRNA interferase MazF
MVKQFPRRGEIYWVNLDPTIGSETKKTRPGLIVSNDLGNEESDVVIIAPITSKIKNVYPFEVELSIDSRPGKVMLNQCRAVDQSRLKQKLGEVDSETMKEVDEAIKIAFSIS